MHLLFYWIWQKKEKLQIFMVCNCISRWDTAVPDVALGVITRPAQWLKPKLVPNGQLRQPGAFLTLSVWGIPGRRTPFSTLLLPHMSNFDSELVTPFPHISPQSLSFPLCGWRALSSYRMSNSSLDLTYIQSIFTLSLPVLLWAPLLWRTLKRPWSIQHCKHTAAVARDWNACRHIWKYFYWVTSSTSAMPGAYSVQSCHGSHTKLWTNNSSVFELSALSLMKFCVGFWLQGSVNLRSSKILHTLLHRWTHCAKHDWPQLLLLVSSFSHSLQLSQICPPAPALGYATADVLHRGPFLDLMHAVFPSSAESEEKNLVCFSSLEDCAEVGIPSTADPSLLLVYILLKRSQT